ncbi:uncharacterized protein zgc:193505 [Xyrauchen texanus]|uniref:uncharacterized protein zgc:193505 n=1 Tax=Xyrauchen texanus TaxID=154827 RepID=UPI002241C503|nr:uncharacterized protein zgc:193505 [Xyrauchen texanus]
MSFLSGILGNKAANSFVDQAVDKAASAAKRKVKETITGKKQDKPDKTGGMGGLFPSEEDKKPKQKSGGGIFGGLLSAEPGKEGMSSGGVSSGGDSIGGVSSGGDSSFNDALDDLATEFADK